MITHESLVAGTDAGVALDACGLVPLMPLTGMLAPDVAPPSHVPPELQLLRPQDDHACATLLDVNGLAYGMDLEAGKAIIGTQSFWSGHFPALGLAEGAPASAAAVFMVDGYRYVALVATDPARQRRGYGDAVMRHALELSARVHGRGPTTLHATEAGRPIYERMGYAPIAAHTVFIEKKFLDGEPFSTPDAAAIICGPVPPAAAGSRRTTGRCRTTASRRNRRGPLQAGPPWRRLP